MTKLFVFVKYVVTANFFDNHVARAKYTFQFHGPLHTFNELNSVFWESFGHGLE